MSTTVTLEQRPFSVAKVFALHLMCFVFPVNALAFSLTGPHPWKISLLFLIPVILSVMADRRSPPEGRQPTEDIPTWPFDALLVVLVFVQFANVLLLANMYRHQDFWSIDTLVAYIVVGANSGYSGIVLAHELIHRKSRLAQQVGRLVLVTVMYEHFSTEHIKGHHARVGTREDPATARFGEDFRPFLRRTIPAQFRSAWRLECKRLGDPAMKLFDLRQLRNRVLHGFVFEWAFAFGIFAVCGAAAFWVFLLQAWQAIQLLEIVNYFEHWGLVREGPKVRTIDSWDTDSFFTLYSLIGLSRHADHHAHASRPFQQLRRFEESPKLPFGYFGTVTMIFFRNTKFKELATEELQRRKLGPFAGTVSA